MKMAEGTKEYYHNEIVKWIEKKFKNKAIYKDLEECREFREEEARAREKDKFFIYPRLSIDLIRAKKVPEEVEEEQREKGKKTKEFNHYTLFFAISSKKIFEKPKEMEDLKKRLLFYQFYLSRISEPKRIKIIVVVPHYVEVPKQSLEFLKKSGFGLWQVNIEKKEYKEVHPPKSLQDRMAEEFKESIDDPKNLGKTIKRIFKKKAKDFSAFKEAIKGKEPAKNFALFFEQYILDSVDAIAGVKPDKFGMRYIDRTLLNLTLELDEVSYIKKLKKLVNEQLDEDYDDYAFVSEVFSALWEEEIGIPYSRFLKIFEPALLHVFPVGEEIDTKVHRDHYIHQFQVFLLGLYIIDKFYEYFTHKCEKPLLQWLIISSFHDMAYPIQLYDEWSKKFFQEVFRVPQPLARIELKSKFVDQSFLSCMGYLICSLYGRHKDEKLEDNWIADKDELVQFFYQEITELKNHCVLSSISLLKTLKDASLDQKNIMRKKISKGKHTFDAILKDVFAPSALAIALHDKGVWEQLRKESGKDHPLKILDGIEFSNDPLSFLLIFCDNIQEWGRPSKSPAEEQGQKERVMKFRLKNIKFDPEKKRLDVTIWTPQHERTEQFFINKFGELTAMQFFLRQPPEIRFTIHLEDKDGEVAGFEMESPLSEESIARSE